MPFLAPLLARSREAAIAALGAAKFQAGFEAGQRLDRDGGLRLASVSPPGSAGRRAGAAAPGERWGRSRNGRPTSRGWSPTG